MAKRKLGKPRLMAAHVDRLYKAVANYIEKGGGKLVVIGGVELQDWGEGIGKFRLAIRCLGRKPKFAASEKNGKVEQR